MILKKQNAYLQTILKAPVKIQKDSACTNCQNQEVPGLPTTVAPISGSPGDQTFSLTFRNSTSIFLNSHLWSKTAILKLNNT